MKTKFLSIFAIGLLAFTGCKKISDKPVSDTEQGKKLKSGLTTLSTINHTYTSDNSTNFPNPERGWFYTIDPNYSTNATGAPLTLSQLNNLKSQYNITLVRKYYMLYPYLNTTTLPSTFLTSIQNDLNTCRAAGFKLIPRFTYNWNQGVKNGTKDGTLAITTSHISQIMAVLNSNIDVVDHLQAGFVGAWAEWHNSYNLHVANYTLQLNSSGLSIINALFSGLSNKRMIAMRYPHFFNQLYNFVPLPSTNWYNGSQQARMGFHNDGYAYDNTDFGTYSLAVGTTPDPQRDFMKQQTVYTISSGEPAGKTTGTPSPSYIVNDLKTYHFSSLSMNMPDAINQGFYSAIPTIQYDSISRLLGYRYSLVSSSIPDTAPLGGSVLVAYSIINNGFAANHNVRGVELVLRNNSTGTVYRKDLVEDPRYWFGGVTKNLSTNINLAGIPAGTYSLLLNLPDSETSLSTNPAYSIRLANTGLWEASTGYNSLQHNLIIQ
jgi:hypothetical protein